MENSNTVRFSFFILMKKLKNELYLNKIKINFMIIITSMVYTNPCTQTAISFFW